jgi:UDP:flavonoid glycosyltransferase YjiC (YdhE family)
MAEQLQLQKADARFADCPSGAPKRILFATIGSLGDLHPCLGLALELKRRGHIVTIATTEFYRSKVEELGIAFRPLRPNMDPTSGEMIAKCQDIRRGPEILIRELVLPFLEDTYADLLTAASDADLMLAGELLYPAPLVAEKLALRWASIILSPVSFLSAYDPSVLVPMPGLIRLRNAGWFVNRVIIKFGEITTHGWWGSIRRLREKEGLGPGVNPLTADKFSPDLVLALFSTALAKTQPDWPKSTVQPGFVFYDSARTTDRLADQLCAFLEHGDAPIVFTQGSTAVHHPGEFYKVSVEAARLLGKRALLIGAKSSPDLLGPDVLSLPYAPYSSVFHRAAVIVHQGGSGTTGQAMRAGRPMLIVPFGWDQPDNGARIERTGAGLSLARNRYSARSAAQALDKLVSNPQYSACARDIAAQVRAEDAVASARNSIELLLQR